MSKLDDVAVDFSEQFGKTAKSQRINLNADEIFSQLHPDLLAVSDMERPSDVRMILKTADMSGHEYRFGNHGHPDNEMSNVAFDGGSAIMVMPAGETPIEQIFSANQIAEAMKKAGVDSVTPEFLEKHIVSPDGDCREFVDQIYGPAPFAEQDERIVPCEITFSDGARREMEPIREDGYTIGMRPPTLETAVMVICHGAPDEMFIRGSNGAKIAIDGVEQEAFVSMKGDNTALENLDGTCQITKAIVISKDPATDEAKPIRVETAKDIFDLSKMNEVYINADGEVFDQGIDTDNLDKLKELYRRQAFEEMSGNDGAMA